MIGRTIAGFRIVGLLGRGGMGEVWKAEQVGLRNRLVALKLLRADRATAGQAIKRLQNEGGHGANLKHSGIAQVYAAGEAEGLPYVAMEYVEGESLAKRLEHGALDPAEARRITLALADALAHAHGRDVLHRDVTPNNIMLEPGGRVVLLDFGLALALGQSRVTSDDVVLGTVHYIAPEVLRRFDADARSDVYALGVVFYESLAGAPPFAGDRREQVEHAVLHESPDPPGRRRTGLPAAWDHVALRAIAREPGLRFQSMREFAAALQALEEPTEPAAVDSNATTREVVPRDPGAPRVLRVAVMPFTDLGGTPEGAALADGFADAIAVALERHPQLSIVPAISTRELAGQGLRSVAREFGVDHVLSGALHRQGDGLRVTCTMVDTRTASQVFAESLDGTLRELRDIELSLVRAIAGALGIASPAPIASGRTGSNPVADEHFLQARGYLQRSDDEASVDGAIRLLEPLSERAEAGAGVWSKLATAYRRKYKHTLERAWLERAQRAVSCARAADPASAEALAESGQLHVLLGRHEEAEQELRAAGTARPDLVEPRSGLVALLKSQGRIDEAEAECRSAIAMRPDAWALYNQLGALLFEQGRYEGAIEAFEQVVRLMPGDSRAPSNIGSAYFMLGRLEDAEVAYRLALEHQRTALALTGLGTVLFYRSDLPAAVEAFERAAGLRENDPVMWGNLGAALRWLPDSSERARDSLGRAITLARESLALNPRDAGLMADLASWLAARGELAEALEWMLRALKLDPESAHNHAHAVTLHELRGERADSLRILERAILLGCRWEEFERDRDLVQLRSTPEYRALRKRHARPGERSASSVEGDPRS